MSRLVKEIVGAVEIIAGVALEFIPGGQMIGTMLIMSGVATLGSALLAPSTKQQGRQAAAVTLQLGEVPRQAIFGEVVTAGGLLDAFNYGGQYGTDWEAVAIGAADHRCHALLGLYVNDSYVAFAGSVGTPWTVPGYNSQLVVTWHEGTEAQSADGTLTAHGGWSSDDNLAGVAYVLVSYKADDAKAKNPVWSAGRPRLLFHIQGKHCYDPRKDSTVAGGSGAHRWADASTWEWSDNPIICRHNWQRGVYACDRVTQPEQLLVGRGLSDVEAPPENVAWRANICDEAVALAAGGSEARYRASVTISADEQFLNTEEMWAASCAGVIRQPQGAVEVDPGHVPAITFAITDDDLVTGEKLTFYSFRSDADTKWVNTVIPRYVEPTQKWADHAAPIRRVYADLIADGGPREQTLSLPAVTFGTQAQRCGEIARRLGRLVRYGGFTLGPRFASVEDGDWGTWTSARHTGGLPIVVRIESCALNEKWRNTLTFREVANSVFSWSTGDEIAPGAVAIDNVAPVIGGAPDSGDWHLIGGDVAGPDGQVQPALILSGAVSDNYAVKIVTEYRVDGATDWQADATLDPTTMTRAITGVAASTDYEVAVSYQVRGVVGARLILGPVTSGSLSGPRGAYRVETQTLSGPWSADDNSITIDAYGVTIDAGSTVSLPSGSITGLISGDSYGLFWKLSTSAYVATLQPSAAEWASQDYIFLVWMTTSAAGVFPSPDPTPPGYGGIAPNCVTDDTLILMADGSEIAARDLRVGDFVRTQHEDGLAWGDWPIEAIRFVIEPIYAATIGNTLLRGTREHRVWIDGSWVTLGEIGKRAGKARVAKISVAGARTYVSAGVLSHNIKLMNADITDYDGGSA